MGHGRFRAPLLTFSIVAIALIGIIGLELHGSAPDEAPARALPVKTKPVPRPAPSWSNAPADQVAQAVGIILERPLFSPGRRPDAVAAAAPSATANPLARLTGVIRSPAGKTAIFAGPADGNPIVIGEGGRIGEYVIGRIEDGAVTITGPDGQRVLYPAFDPNPPPKRPVPAPNVPPIPPLPPMWRGTSTK